jgi:pimeloyl-ACP methyl ester carboxylesterase
MTWVLLRGLTREARHWGGFADQFAQRVAPDRVTALDLPGNGEFYQLPSPTSVSAMVGFARQQLLKQSIQPPYKLLAMSLGGMVATDWAQRYPHEVDRLVLINTSMRPFSGVTERLRPANWPPLGLLAARWADADHAESTVHQLTCNHIAQRAADLMQWQQIRKTAPVSSPNALRQLLAAARFSCASTAPRCQVLVLSSCADRLVNPVCSTQLAQAWQAEHHSHRWAGHDLPHDDGPWVGERVADWLSRHYSL